VIPVKSSENAINGLSKQAQNKEFMFDRLYKNLCNPNMYMKAYSNIYSNDGSATRGITSETTDGLSEDKIVSI